MSHVHQHLDGASASSGDEGGFCCSTEICVTVPDCAKAEVSILDLLNLIASWGVYP